MKVIVLLSQQINRIITVSLQSLSLVDPHSSVSIENGPFSLFFSKILFKSLTDAVNVLLIELCLYLQVILAENKLLIVRGENDGACCFSCDFEIKGVF